MDFGGAGREDCQNECTDISLTCKCCSQSTDHKELQNAALHLLLKYFMGMKRKKKKKPKPKKLKSMKFYPLREF